MKKRKVRSKVALNIFQTPITSSVSEIDVIFEYRLVYIYCSRLMDNIIEDLVYTSPELENGWKPSNNKF